MAMGRHSISSNARDNPDSQPPNGWRCAALPGQATDVQMRRGRAGAELRHKAPTGTWRRAEGAGATPQASHAPCHPDVGNVSTSALLGRAAVDSFSRQPVRDLRDAEYMRRFGRFQRLHRRRRGRLPFHTA